MLAKASYAKKPFSLHTLRKLAWFGGLFVMLGAFIPANGFTPHTNPNEPVSQSVCGKCLATVLQKGSGSSQHLCVNPTDVNPACTNPFGGGSGSDDCSFDQATLNCKLLYTKYGYFNTTQCKSVCSDAGANQEESINLCKSYLGGSEGYSVEFTYLESNQCRYPGLSY